MQIIPDGRRAFKQPDGKTKLIDKTGYEKKIVKMLAEIKGHSQVAKIFFDVLKITKGRTGVVRILPTAIDKRLNKFGKRMGPHYDHRDKKGQYHPIIFFDPIDTTTSNDPHKIDDARTTLLHELVHAAFQNKGFDQKWSGMSSFWTDKAEFAAITIANMYRAERGYRHLRYGHQNDPTTGNVMSLAVEMNNPKFRTDDRLYRKEFARPIKSMFFNAPPLCDALSRLSVKWNPLRGGRPKTKP